MASLNATLNGPAASASSRDLRNSSGGCCWFTPALPSVEHAYSQPRRAAAAASWNLLVVAVRAISCSSRR